MEDLARIKFINAPVKLMARANEHQQELLREFILIQFSDDATKQDVPRRLLELVERLRLEFSSLAFRGGSRLAEAMRRGDGSIDMEIDVPSAARGAAEEMLATLTEADEFCRRGQLLTLATPPELVAFRAWFLGEIMRQIDGSEPTPWRDPAES